MTTTARTTIYHHCKQQFKYYDTSQFPHQSDALNEQHTPNYLKSTSFTLMRSDGCPPSTCQSKHGREKKNMDSELTKEIAAN